MCSWKNEEIKNTRNWTTFVLWLNFFYHSHVIIQTLNTIFLWQNYQHINHDNNLQLSHVLCSLRTKIQSLNDIEKFINISKYSYISIYGGHGLIMIYNMQMLLHSYDKAIWNEFEYIIATFYIKTHMCL
jgi:hypothetical protein